jgi:hypothetical protein
MAISKGNVSRRHPTAVGRVPPMGSVPTANGADRPMLLKNSSKKSRLSADLIR